MIAQSILINSLRVSHIGRDPLGNKKGVHLHSLSMYEPVRYYRWSLAAVPVAVSH